MAYEGRRLSTESEKSSTSTTHSNTSPPTYSNLIPQEQKVSTSTSRISPTKHNSTMSSPAELILARTKNTYVDLNGYFQCSSLPSHWRKNKSLRFILRTRNQIEIKSNTRVVILAGNEYNPCASLKNNISWFRGGQAEFNDLRFLGVSGRGKKFTLTIIIETSPPQQCTYRRAIKITVDGPRKKRELKSKSDVNDIQADESNIDDDSDNETQTTDVSMKTETKSTISQGSSGLLLLAAAAEQKRIEDDDPMNHLYQSENKESCYSSLCLSPLARQFSQSIGFSVPSDDLTSHVTRHVFLPTPSVISSTPKGNLLLNEYLHQQRHDQQTRVTTTTTTNPSSSNTSTSTHVLCR